MRRAALALALCSCAAVRPLTASNVDAADHRAFTLARFEGQRLRFAAQYLDRHPDGAWAPDVRAAFAVEEPRYYAASQKSRAAAVDYLAWLPRGPHAEAALALVLSFDEHEPETESARMVAAARANEARLERASQDREEAENAALESLRAVLDASVYGKKLEDDGELTRFLLAGRSIGTTPSRRTRFRRFTVPTRNGPIERTLEITIDVHQSEDGVVTGATVTGPELFARMAEASLLHEVTRAEADRYVRDVLETMTRAEGAALRLEIDPDLVRISPSK